MTDTPKPTTTLSDEDAARIASCDAAAPEWPMAWIRTDVPWLCNLIRELDARLATAERVISDARGNRCRCCGSTFMRLRAENEKRVDTIAELRFSQADLRERLRVAEERIALYEIAFGKIEERVGGPCSACGAADHAYCHEECAPASDAAPKEMT